MQAKYFHILKLFFTHRRIKVLRYFLPCYMTTLSDPGPPETVKVK